MSNIAMSYSNKKVLVTGGAGFIGSHLVERLVKLGAHVTVLDDFSKGSISNLSSVVNEITLVGGTIVNFELCLKAAKGNEIIFHCAAQTSVPESMENPLYCHDTNIQGTYNLLQAAYAQKIARFVFSSSSAVYGEQVGRCGEDLRCNPSSVYGVSKWLGEELCKKYYTLFKLETVCLRYFNVYGERQDALGSYAAAVAKFKYSMMHNKPIIMYGDGLQTRDFVSVHEVVNANVMVGALPAGKVAGESINIASGSSITLLDLVKRLQQAEFPNFNQEIVFAPARPGDIRHIEADCSKYRAVVNGLEYC